MDLFSGSFACFKPVGKLATADELENDQQTKEKIKIWVLRCSQTGRVHYLEAYKDFVDVLLGFLMLRTGALIRLNHELSPAMKQKTSGGIHGLYDSFKRLDDSVVLVDKEILLDPFERLKVSEELQALDNGDFECCNADCFKYLSGSRQICRSCTISTHFSCISCGGYFRENAHTSLCYTPWRPWRNHMTAAPVLTRYTVIQSCPPTANKQKKEGYVRKDMPFIVTNELIITPLSTSTLSEVLKSCGAGSCEDLECNELSIGTPEVLVMLGAALTSPTPLTDIFGKMCNERNRVSSSGSGASFTQFPPCETISKFCDQDGSSTKRSRSVTTSKVPSCEKKTSKSHTHNDSSRRRPTPLTPCCESKPDQKMSKFEDHDDSSLRRRMTMTSSAVPPSEKTSRPRDGKDSSIQRETSLVKHAMMSQNNSPDQSPRQSPRQSPLGQRVDTPTGYTLRRSSLGRESPQKQIPRKISFQEQSAAYELPEPQPDCLGSVCPSPPPSPRAIASESSFIDLSNFGNTPQQSLLREQHQVRRFSCRASCTPNSSRSSTSGSELMEQMSSPIRRLSMSSEQVLPQAPLTTRPNSICPIDDCAQVSSQSSPLRPKSMSITNPLFQQVPPTHYISCSKSSQPPTLPPLRAPSIIEDELLPCIARQSQNENNLRHGPSIVHRSLSPAVSQPGVTNYIPPALSRPGVTNYIQPAVNFRKKSGGTGIPSLTSVAAAFEHGSECTCSESEDGSDSCDNFGYSDDIKL